jgi:hypothetical protein
MLMRIETTNVPGVFASGDLVRGSDLVVCALRDSRKTAVGIHKYLSHRSNLLTLNCSSKSLRWRGSERLERFAWRIEDRLWNKKWE